MSSLTAFTLTAPACPIIGIYILSLSAHPYASYASEKLYNIINELKKNEHI